MKKSSCQGCGSELPSRSGVGQPRKWCSEACRVRAHRARKPKKPARQNFCTVVFSTCKYCLNLVTSSRRRTYCRDAECKRAYDREKARAFNAAYKQREGKSYSLNYPHHKREADRRRAILKRQLPAERFSDLEIFERDNWICGICQTPVDQSLKFPHLQAKTLDHIKPLAKGGHHTRDNVQLAHHWCNMSKNDSYTEVA